MRSSHRSPPFVIGAFANAILEQDYELAHACLSRSLQQRLSISELRDTLLEAEDEAAAVSFAWRSTDMTYRDWNAGREGAAPPDVFPDTFVSWSCIEFQGDLEACYQIWCLLISEGDQERIALLQITDPD